MDDLRASCLCCVVTSSHHSSEAVGFEWTSRRDSVNSGKELHDFVLFLLSSLMFTQVRHESDSWRPPSRLLCGCSRPSHQAALPLSNYHGLVQRDSNLFGTDPGLKQGDYRHSLLKAIWYLTKFLQGHILECSSFCPEQLYNVLLDCKKQMFPGPREGCMMSSVLCRPEHVTPNLKRKMPPKQHSLFIWPDIGYLERSVAWTEETESQKKVCCQFLLGEHLLFVHLFKQTVFTNQPWNTKNWFVKNEQVNDVLMSLQKNFQNQEYER